MESNIASTFAFLKRVITGAVLLILTLTTNSSGQDSSKTRYWIQTGMAYNFVAPHFYGGGQLNVTWIHGKRALTLRFLVSEEDPVKNDDLDDFLENSYTVHPAKSTSEFSVMYGIYHPKDRALLSIGVSYVQKISRGPLLSDSGNDRYYKKAKKKGIGIPIEIFLEPVNVSKYFSGFASITGNANLIKSYMGVSFGLVIGKLK